MKIAKNYKKHIYCLEGDWDADLRNQSSIHAALLFLQQNCGIKFIHKHCGTKESLAYYLKKWGQKKYSSYSICYLSFHGEPDNIHIGKEVVTLNELADMLGDSCKDKIIHFGTCLTLSTNNKSIKNFLNKTQALCVCGFKSSVDFLASSVFDMILLEMLQDYKDISCVERDLNLYYDNLVRNLDFKIVYL